MALTLVTRYLEICFASNIALIALELTIVALEWAFAVVGKFVPR